ncbi:MAG: PD-(D/E)XK nuclease family protein [candidate division WOR-3 bacterium]
MIEKFQYTPILGWSFRRYEIFKMCKRQYFYEYYPKFDDFYSEYKIKELKALTSIPLSIGIITHKIIAIILKRLMRSEREININKLWEFVKEEIERYCKNNTFSEIYYGETKKLNKEKLFSSIKLSLENLLDSNRFNWIKENAIKNKKNWIIDPPGYGEFRLSGIKLYCKVDFLFPFEDNFYIIDWKTGKEDIKKHKKQLMGYLWWGIYHLQKEPKKFLTISAYLTPEYSEKEIKFKEYELENFIYNVKKETEEMFSFCKDIEQNIPIPKEKFEKTSKKKICSFCNYREICVD